MSSRKANAAQSNQQHTNSRQAYVRDESSEEQDSFPPDTPSPSNLKIRLPSITPSNSIHLNRFNHNQHHKNNSDLVTASTSSISSSTRTKSGLSTLQPFFQITPFELQFFDQLISILPNRSSSFSELKRGYEQCLSGIIQEGNGKGKGKEREADEMDRDERLWNLLLSLLPIRGKNWSDKWDSVRMGIGMEPRSEGEVEEETSGSGEQSSGSDDEGKGRNGTNQLRPNGDIQTGKRPENGRDPSSIKSRMEALTQQAGALAIQASKSSASRSSRDPDPDPEKLPAVHINQAQQQLLRGRGIVKGPRSNPNSNSPNPVSTSNINRSLAQKGSFQSDTNQMRREEEQSQENQPRRKVRVLAPSSEAAYELEQSNLNLSKRRVNQNHSIPRSESQPNFQEPRSNINALPSTSRQTTSIRKARFSEPFPTSSPDQTSTTPTQKKFDEVVRAARAERESLRLAEQSRLEAEEERLWSLASTKAASYYNQNLTFKVLGWWSSLTRRRMERIELVGEGRDKVLVGRKFEAWLERVRIRKEKMGRAGKIDEVRCLLGGWRKWRKKLEMRHDERKEEKKRDLKKAYSLVVKNGNGRLLFNSWEVSPSILLANSKFRCPQRNERSAELLFPHLSLSPSITVLVSLSSFQESYSLSYLSSSDWCFCVLATSILKSRFSES